MAKKKASIGCLFWVALILLVLVIVLFNYKQINTVLKNTGMDKYIDNLLNKSGKSASSSQAPSKTEPPRQQENRPAAPSPQKESPQAAQPSHTPAKPTRAPLPPEDIALVDEKPPVRETPDNFNVRNANIYYIRLGDGGEIDCIPVKRKVKYTDSPLTSTLETLLKGPTLQETNSGLTNLIPSGSKLKNIYVRNSTAYLDFNESFRFNIGAKEGMLAQLKQIIYTSTEFINVQAVQIMIEGQVLDYLGPEGVYIGRPLARGDF